MYQYYTKKTDRKPYEKLDGGKTVCIEDEVPFDLPPGWAWARLGTICDAQLGKMLDKAKNVGAPYKYLANANVRWGSFDYSDIRETLFTPEEVEKFDLREGDVVMCEGGVPGRCAVWQSEVADMKFQKAVHRLRSSVLTPLLIQNFFAYAVNTDWFKAKFTGTTIKHLPREALISILIPISPIAEQKRIVAKIEELFAEVEKIANAKDGITHTAERINKKVLNLAIRGQLVPQDASDEPAAELLKRIAEARQKATTGRSRAAGKNADSVIFRGADRSAYETRNGKTVCIDDEIPFEIPDSWAWARLRTVLLPMESKLPSGEWFEYIDIDAIDNKRNRVTTPKKLKVVDAPSRASRGLKTGDTLFSVVRPYLRNIAHINARLTNCIASTGFYVCRPSAGVDDQYLFNLLCTDYVVNGLNAFMKGDNSPSIRVEHIHDFIVPIPPLAEQKRIVAKVGEVRNFVELITQT